MYLVYYLSNKGLHQLTGRLIFCMSPALLNGLDATEDDPVHLPDHSYL